MAIDCLRIVVEHVTDRRSNPFGMRPPFERHDPGDVAAVFGYGDVNADFHLIGDHPGIHGGRTTGIPFTETADGLAVQDVFRETGFITGRRDEPIYENLFGSYRHMCTLPDGRAPTTSEYDTLERFFDAELRAVNAHILLPVGERVIDDVLTTYTTQRHRFGDEVSTLHARDIRGRGFMVVPIAAPSTWTSSDRDRLVATLEGILAADYRQTKGVATMVG